VKDDRFQLTWWSGTVHNAHGYKTHQWFASHKLLFLSIAKVVEYCSGSKGHLEVRECMEGKSFSVNLKGRKRKT
jgi:hypothetical protein